MQISGPVVFEQYEVICDYKKKNKNDISLTAGDVVDVIEKNDYGTYSGISQLYLARYHPRFGEYSFNHSWNLFSNHKGT